MSESRLNSGTHHATGRPKRTAGWISEFERVFVLTAASLQKRTGTMSRRGTVIGRGRTDETGCCQ